MTGPGALHVEIDGMLPDVSVTAYLAPTAVLVGHVRVEDDASIWFGCVLRGDQAPILIRSGANIQDGTVVHGDVEVSRGVTVGHACVLHETRIGAEALIGMGALLLDGSEIGAGAVVAPGAVVVPGTVVAPGMLVAGVPAKPLREVSDQDRLRIEVTARSYAHLGRAYRGVEPLDRSVWGDLTP